MIISPTLFAGKADVVDVKVSCSADSCNFNVTVKHADSGWEHYANEWMVMSGDGSILGTRVLYHPHVNEQPFTRSLSGVKVSHNIKQVVIRAKDSKHGYGGLQLKIAIPAR